MMDKELREILTIYFELTDRPKGARLIRGDLQISDYIDDIISGTKEDIQRYELRVQENEGKRFEDTWKRKLREAVVRLEHAERHKANL